MSLVVQKYGASAVTGLDQIKDIAKRIIDSYNSKHDVVVVVSAKAGETNRLIEMANYVCPGQEGRDYDVLISTGEQLTVALLAMAITSMGYNAKTYLGWQVPINTNSLHAKASIENINPDNILHDLKRGVIAIVAGFQGIDTKGNIMTLGAEEATFQLLHLQMCYMPTIVNYIQTWKVYSLLTQSSAKNRAK